MTTTADARATVVPARTIPIPVSVSPAAQAALQVPSMGAGTYPDLDDPDAWRALIAATDAALVAMFEARNSGVVADVRSTSVAGVPVHLVTPEGCEPTDRRVYLDIHGGGLIMGGGEACRAMGIKSAAQVGARTWSVDYRMPPDHPYPAPLDDCVAVYRALLDEHRPEDIIVGGASAGGNLVAAMILRARDEGLPLPAAAVLLTPEVDLTESGDTFHTNLGIDNVLVGSLRQSILLYAAGHDLDDPYLSPLFGDFTRGFPPTFLQTGTRDFFLSNTVRMHRALRRAGIDAELHVFEAMPHGGFGGAPEDAELDAEVRRFVDARWR
jgi:monoterpene epsilon-lactone hydrolase